MIVPGSASFPAIASLGRRLLPALPAVRCIVVLPLTLIMILIMLFFFTFTLLLFGFLSHFAHCSCSFLSASFPSARLDATTLARPVLVHPFAWFSCSYVRLVYYPLLAFAFARFWLHSPLPHHPILPKRGIPSLLPALRETRFTPGLLLAPNSLIPIYATRVPGASPANPSLVSFS